MKILKFLPFLCLFSSCTYSINMIHSEGVASDMIDENQTASPDVSPDIKTSLSFGEPINYPPSQPRGMNGLDRKSI